MIVALVLPCGLFAAALAQGSGLPAFNVEQRTTEPLLRPDQPASWDHWIGFLNVIQTNDTWLLWYNSIDTNYVDDQDQRLCYATSTNGVDWVKPLLGRVDYHGSTSNNIIKAGGVAGAYVFWDSHAARYRMTVVRDVPGDPVSYVVFGLDSSNGLDWIEYPDPIFNFNSDTQTTCFWDVDRYRLYPRMWTLGTTQNPFQGLRTVGYSESTTFTNFPAPTQILAPVALDPPNSHYYNNAATKLAENLYVMFISVYENPGAGTQKPHLAVSTNGVDFVRVGHAPVLPLGVGTGSFDSATLYVGPGCTPGPRPNTYWFYYAGNNVDHEHPLQPNRGGLGRFLLTILPEEDGGDVPLTYKTGLLTWLRADDLDADRNVTNNPADGTPVALWKDSNNAVTGNPAAQTNDINQPTYRTTGGPNNTPLVQFDGTNDYLQFPSIAYSNWTLFIVGRMPAGPTHTALAFADYGPNGASYPALHMYRLTGTMAFTAFNRDQTTHIARADDTNGWSRFAIRSAWVTNAAMNYRVVTESNTYAGAGTPVAGYAAAAMGGDLPPTLGDLPPASGTYAANLELSEFLLFDHTLSDAARDAVEEYLRVKYFPESNNPTPAAASFSASPRGGPAPLAVTFTDTSTGTITNRLWDFGDGQTLPATTTVLAHTYTNLGGYTVSLTVAGPAGTSTVTRASHVVVAPLTYRNGLLTWLRADDLDGDGSTNNNPADGTAVPLWRDSNAGDNDATQGVASNQPVYRVAGGPNNMPLVALDGTNDFLELPELNYTSASFTLFLVGRMPAGPTNTAIAFGDYGFAGVGGCQTFPTLLIFRTLDTAWFAPFVRDGNCHTMRADDTNGWSRHAIRSTWVQDTTVRYRVTDGTNAYDGAGTPEVSFNANTTLDGYHFPTIGALPPFGQNNANLELCELLLYGHTLTDGQRAEVESYLKAKYYPPTPPTYAAEVLLDTPLVYWRLNEKSGGLAYDATPNNRTALNAGGVTMGVAGNPGTRAANSAFAYDGLDDETTLAGEALLAPAPAGFAPGQGWSVEAWARFPSAVATSGTLVAWFMERVDGTTDGYALGVDPVSGAAQGIVRDHAGATAAVTGAQSLHNGAWHHLVLTFGRNALNAPFSRLYQNGALIAVDTNTVLNTMTGTASVTLGWLPTSNTMFTAVTLDEVALYNYALSPTRIETHYRAGTILPTGPMLLIR